MAFKIAEAFVEVKADGTGLRGEVFREVEAAGVGQDIKVGVSVRSGALGGLMANLAPFILPGIVAVGSLTGVLGLVPAAAGAAGLAIGVIKIGIGAFKEDLDKLPPSARSTVQAVRDLAPAWASVRTDVQSHLFAGLSDVVRRVGATDLPVLRTGLVSMGDSFNQMFRNAGAWATSTKTVADLRTIMDNSAIGGQNLARAIQPILGIIRDIAAVGSTFLPQLTSGFATAAQRVADFVSYARQTGQLGQWIQTGITAFGSLWQIVKNLVGIMMQLANAPGFGPTLLSGLATVTGWILKLITAVPELIPLITGAMVAWRAYTVVQWAVNAAMAANPVGLWIAAIGALIAIIVLAITHWDQIKAAISSAVSVITSVIMSGVNQVVSLWNAGWSAVSSFVTNALNTVRGVVTGVIAAIVGIIAGGVANVRGALNWFGSLGGLFAGWWNAAVSAVSGAVGSLMGVVSSIPGRVSGALGNLGGLLVGAGRAMIQGLVNGILGMIGAVTGAVSRVVSAARALLPFSPAKEGPFSGRGYTTYSGAALMSDWAKGMASQEGAVLDAASRIATTVRGVLSGPQAASTGASGSSAATTALRSRYGGPVTVNVTQTAGSPAETGRMVALALRTVG